VIATWAIFRSSFEWFCFGTFLLGANRGATQQYRFAAAEIADEAFRSKAISLVLAGGVVSAVFGAEVAKWSRDLFEPVLFAGCYALILVLFLASAVLLYFVELPRRQHRCWPAVAGRCARSPWSRRSSRRRWWG
jgi:predicted MFS family arabinose efflux permease